MSRFAAVFPGRALPADLSVMSFAEQMALKDRDPGLYQVMAGDIDAGTEAQLIGGTWPAQAPAGPTEAEVKAAHVASLVAAGNPFMPRGQGEDLTRQMLLRRADPQAAAHHEALAQPYHALVEANKATAAAQAEQARIEAQARFANAQATSAARTQLLGHR